MNCPAQILHFITELFPAMRATSIANQGMYDLIGWLHTKKFRSVYSIDHKNGIDAAASKISE